MNSILFSPATVSYDGNRDAYLNFMKDVSEGVNLYSIVFSTYNKDTLNVNSNYVLAKKLMFRYQVKDAVDHFNKVLLYDRDNKLRHNPECRFRIAEGELMLMGDDPSIHEGPGHIPQKRGSISRWEIRKKQFSSRTRQ